ncbi:MAG: DNA-directed RNA polymerase subunit alpha C-terminal domain-containing protein, partial [Chloroflexota bacterium]
HIATLDSDDAKLTVEFNVEQGMGYVQAGARNGLPIGVLPIDAIFTPVRRVNYRVESARVGQAINYDRMVLDVWTDGTISPVTAVNQSARLLMEQFSHFAHLGIPAAQLPAGGGLSGVPTGGRYDMAIEELALSVRAYNALKRHNITTVGQVLGLTDSDLMNIRNFGEKSMTELKDKLVELGFTETAANGSSSPESEGAATA